MNSYFLHSETASRPQRVLVLALAIGLYLLGRDLITPFVSRLVPVSGIDSDGLRLLFRHAVTFSLPTALVCLAGLWALDRASILRFITFAHNPRRALIEGLAWGLGFSALTCALFLAFGQELAPVWNPWSILGNLFSNLYEEIEYRGLLFAALLYAFRNKWIAIFASGFIFTWSHTSQPALLFAGTLMTGLFFAYPYHRTGNLLTPYIVHQLSDMIVDSLFGTAGG